MLLVCIPYLKRYAQSRKFQHQGLFDQGLFDVLFKVPTQPFHKVGSTEQAVESKGQVGMETPAVGSLPGIKEAPGLLPTASTF